MKTAACKKFQCSYSFCKSKRHCSGSNCSFRICTMRVNSECEQCQNNVKELKEGVMNV